MVFGFQSLADATKETLVSRSITSCQIYYVLNLVLTIKQHDRTIVFNESFPTLNSLINKKTITNEHGGKAFIRWKIPSMVENFLVCKMKWNIESTVKKTSKKAERASSVIRSSEYLLACPLNLTQASRMTSERIRTLFDSFIRNIHLQMGENIHYIS